MVTWQIKDIISPLSRGLWIQNLAGHWLFCGCYDRGFRRGKLDNSSISLFLSFVVKESMLYQMLKKRWDELNKIVTNSEIHLYHCLCEPRSFKTGRSNHLRCSIKKCSRKFYKIDRKTFMDESGTTFFRSVLSNFWEHRLIVKNFNLVSLILFNSELLSCSSLIDGHYFSVTKKNF